MGRCRVVQPEVSRLFLVDVYKRAHAHLVAQGVVDAGKKRPATEAELAAAAARTKSAEKDGDWVLVWRRLNAGQQRAMFKQMYLAGIDGQLRVNPLGSGIARVTAYLVEWSISGIDGKVIPIDPEKPDTITSALDAIDPETFAEISQAIAAHEEAMAVEREAEKNAQDGEKNASAISPSPSDVAGVLSGSVT